MAPMPGPGESLDRPMAAGVTFAMIFKDLRQNAAPSVSSPGLTTDRRQILLHALGRLLARRSPDATVRDP